MWDFDSAHILAKIRGLQRFARSRLLVLRARKFLLAAKLKAFVGRTSYLLPTVLDEMIVQYV
jgi:hypothetical protein